MVRSNELGFSPSPTESAPCGSKSTRSTFAPSAASAAPRLIVDVVLPTPPFWLTTATTFPTGRSTGGTGGASTNGASNGASTNGSSISGSSGSGSTSNTTSSSAGASAGGVVGIAAVTTVAAGGGGSGS